MKLNKTNLQKALEIVQPGLATRELIEQSTSFVFMDGRVTTYNDEISISHPIPNLGIEGAIQSTELYQMLAKLKKDEIEADVDENELILKAGRAKIGITLQQEITLPLEQIGEQGKWKKLPEDFIQAIQFALGACSRDMSRPVLTCIHVNQEEGCIESSDSLRLVQIGLESQIPIKSFLIPASSAIELVKLPVTKVATGKGWIHFKTEEDTVFSSRIFEDKYPELTPFMGVEGIEITFPRTISDILDRAGVFAKRDHFLDEVIVVHIADNRIKVSSRSESGWFEEEANTRYNDSPVSFLIVPYLLKDILSETRTCVICEDRLKFEGLNWKYVSVLREEVE